MAEGYQENPYALTDGYKIKHIRQTWSITDSVFRVNHNLNTSVHFGIVVPKAGLFQTSNVIIDANTVQFTVKWVHDNVIENYNGNYELDVILFYK